jgi:hypothetical protein
MLRAVVIVLLGIGVVIALQQQNPTGTSSAARPATLAPATSTPRATTAPRPSPTSARLAREQATADALESMRLELLPGAGCQPTSSQNFVTYEGRVRNVSGQTLRNVRAVVTYLAADGTFITSDSARVDFDPLLDGQVSPFKTITRYNPAIASCLVEFQLGFGPKITVVRAAQ